MPASYEELRDATVACLLGETGRTPPNQWLNLKFEVGIEMARRRGEPTVTDPAPRVTGSDAELLRDVFWDLFRQGHITMGLDDLNAQWPFFRISHFGHQALTHGTPYRFTDSSSYIRMVRQHAPDLDRLTRVYLEEAIGAFHAGCMLAACVMLGVAAEHRVELLISAAEKSLRLPGEFTSVSSERGILRRMRKLIALLQPHLRAMPTDLREGLETHFHTIQEVIRVARNETGHPTGQLKDRQTVYVYLQLYAPFAAKARALQEYLLSDRVLASTPLPRPLSCPPSPIGAAQRGDAIRSRASLLVSAVGDAPR